MQVTGLLQKQCALFGVDVQNAQAIVKALSDAGLTREEILLLIGMYPQILRQRYARTILLTHTKAVQHRHIDNHNAQSQALEGTQAV